jgi:hypothetical protein
VAFVCQIEKQSKVAKMKSRKGLSECDRNSPDNFEKSRTESQAKYRKMHFKTLQEICQKTQDEFLKKKVLKRSRNIAKAISKESAEIK